MWAHLPAASLARSAILMAVCLAFSAASAAEPARLWGYPSPANSAALSAMKRLASSVTVLAVLMMTACSSMQRAQLGELMMSDAGWL